ncbi:MAG TPA: CBS domain-containing protein [Candidatus Saccharimonadales bacterium]|nr:CBS domain-containing protein [Candidatus Saccharimonadales bacterium]
MRIALAGILAFLFLLSVLLDKTLRSLPAKELRRRARAQKDKRAAAVYKLAAFNRSAESFLRLVGVLSAAGLILVAAESNRWLGLVTAVVAFWLVWRGHSPRIVGGWRLSLAALAAPLFTAFVSFLQPFLGRLTDWFRRISPLYPPTGLYEKEDLLEFLKIQARQPDNRIHGSDLKAARGALSLSDRTIGDVMLPRRQIKWVAAGDPIGPMVMDELHKSGQARFPVVKEVTKAASPEIVGALYLKDLLEHLEDKGRIRDIMHPGASYINESQSLRSALDGFLKSGQLLLVVVNNFEEVVGVVTLEDIFEKIFGDKIGDEFDRYHDIRSVSGHNGQTRGQEAHN